MRRRVLQARGHHGHWYILLLLDPLCIPNRHWPISSGLVPIVSSSRSSCAAGRLQLVSGGVIVGEEDCHPPLPGWRYTVPRQHVCVYTISDLGILVHLCPDTFPTNNREFPPGRPYLPPSRRLALFLLSCPSIPTATPKPSGPMTRYRSRLPLPRSDAITFAPGIYSALIPGKVALFIPVAVDYTHGTRHDHISVSSHILCEKIIFIWRVMEWFNFLILIQWCLNQKKYKFESVYQNCKYAF